MDDGTRQIAMLMAAAEEEHLKLKVAVRTLMVEVPERITAKIQAGGREALEEALKTLHPQVERANQTLLAMQRFTVRRAFWQNVVVGLAVALFGVSIPVGAWLSLPSKAEMTALREERDQLQASIEQLGKQGGRVKLNTCGPKGRLCVLVDRAAGVFGTDKAETFMIAKGY